MSENDLTAEMERNGWSRLDNGSLVRTHTKVSAIITNQLDDLCWWGQAAKYAFKIEDELRAQGLLRE